MSKIPVVFFGSGSVALRNLKLISDMFMIEAIITKPATKHEMQLAVPSATVFAVRNRDELDMLCEKQRFRAELAILVDFGIIVSQRVIDAFHFGIINSHFSLLPEWRGADPITFAILSGQKQTGVSLMLLSAGMDEGPLLAQAPYDIPEQVTTPSLTDRLIELSAELLKAVVPEYVAGSASAAPQLEVSIASSRTVTYSRKLTKDDGRLDWSKPAEVLEREVRAYIGWPHSYTTLAGREVIITKAQVADLHGTPGTTLVENRQLYVYCVTGALEILQLKPAGKKGMPACAFLAGYGKQL